MMSDFCLIELMRLAIGFVSRRDIHRANKIDFYADYIQPSLTRHGASFALSSVP